MRSWSARRSVWGLLLLVAVAAVPALIAGPSDASPRPSVVSSASRPIVPTRPQAELGSVSCVSSTFCLAIGHAIDAHGLDQPLAEIWNGTRWRLGRMPAATGTTLTAVSCANPTFCIAVGTLRGGAVIRRFDGTEWHAAAALGPSVNLVDVSCASATACTAVGSDPTAKIAAAWRWDGAGWAAQPIDSPAGSTGSGFRGVACPTATQCTAVGDVSDSDGSGYLAERWDGVAWHEEPTPAPAVFFQVLRSVACPTATTCIAVGTTNLADELDSPVSWVWNGTTWSEVAVPGTTDARPVAVSCITATNCLAVGTNLDDGGSAAWRWNGTSWSTVSRPATGRSHLADVSCAGGSCVAVGHVVTDGRAVAQRWNGSRWSDTHPLNARSARNSRLRAVSCPTTRSCVAVGTMSDHDFDLRYPARPFVERYAGGRWRTVPVPASFGSRAFALGVHCVTSTRCIVVLGLGDANTGVNRGVRFARWTGGHWRSLFYRVPTGTVLTGVSCSSLSSCVVVGTIWNRTARSFVRVWDGARLIARAVPVPRGTYGDLAAVSCARPDDCLAVGTLRKNPPQYSTTHALAEHWDGRQWRRLATPPAPSGVNRNSLTGVSCPAARHCVVAGYDIVRKRSFSDSWDGTRWHRLGGVATSTFSRVESLDCSSRSRCTAVGDSSRGAFVARLHGRTWSVTVTGPPRATAGGVDCASSRCLTVGGFRRAVVIPYARSLRAA